MSVKKKKGRSTILFVDQALSFGGSIVVLGSLVERLDKEKFRPIVVGEMDKSILNYHMQGQAKIYVVPRLINYVHRLKINTVIKRIKPWLLFKLIIYLVSAISSLVNTVYIARLVKIILKEKVNLVHVNNGMSNIEPVIAAILLNRKIVVHFHGIERPGLVQKLLFNSVCRYIVISEFLRSALIKNGFPKVRMTVIPNPVQETHALSDAQQELRSYYGLNKGDKVFAIIGRIVRWKGHIEFLNAAFLVLERVTDAKALIVGDFSDGDAGYQEIIENMVEESGYSDRIIMTGYVKDINNIYSVIDVCVHTSIEPEPFGLVIIEAMANGVPVIASDRGAPMEIITDGVNGYIVNPDSPRKIADVAIRLLDDDKLRVKMGESGRQHVLQHYNAKDYAHSVENIYARVLDEVV